jgi:hypothetical protein
MRSALGQPRSVLCKHLKAAFRSVRPGSLQKLFLNLLDQSSTDYHDLFELAYLESFVFYSSATGRTVVGRKNFFR